MGGGGGGGQQASCLVAKQAVEFPQVLASTQISSRLSPTEYGFAPYAYDVHTYMLHMHLQLSISITAQPGGVGQDHVNTDFADSALLLPLNLYGEKKTPFCWANKTCRALL